MSGVLRRCVVHLIEFCELVLLFLEIHFMKIIMLTAFVLSINYVCFLHIIFVVLSVISTKFHLPSQLFVSRIISLGSAILLILTMIYQIDYIDQSEYQYNCTVRRIV